MPSIADQEQVNSLHVHGVENHRDLVALTEHRSHRHALPHREVVHFRAEPLEMFVDVLLCLLDLGHRIRVPW